MDPTVLNWLIVALSGPWSIPPSYIWCALTQWSFPPFVPLCSSVRGWYFMGISPSKFFVFLVYALRIANFMVGVSPWVYKVMRVPYLGALHIGDSLFSFLMEMMLLVHDGSLFFEGNMLFLLINHSLICINNYAWKFESWIDLLLKAHVLSLSLLHFLDKYTNVIMFCILYCLDRGSCRWWSRDPFTCSGMTH